MDIKGNRGHEYERNYENQESVRTNPYEFGAVEADQASPRSHDKEQEIIWKGKISRLKMGLLIVCLVVVIAQASATIGLFTKVINNEKLQEKSISTLNKLSTNFNQTIEKMNNRVTSMEEINRQSFQRISDSDENLEKRFATMQANYSNSLIKLQESGEKSKMQLELIQANYDLLKDFRASACTAGMKSGKIADNQISSSTPWSASRPWVHRPQLARLDRHTHVDGGCWVPGGSLVGQWIQVNFKKPTLITGVITQGRPNEYAQWVTSFKIGYGDSLNSITNIQKYGGGDKIFPGNSNMNSHKVNMFPTHVTAQYFRLIIASYHGAPALRMDFIYC